MIAKFLAGVLCIAWGLWAGGMAALFLFVMRLFAVDRDLALKTAPLLFIVFERYQIVLAALTILAAAGVRFSRPSRAASALFLTLAIPVMGAGFGVLLVDKMIGMWLDGQSSGPQFMRLHGMSMLLFTAQEVILLVAGLMLPWVIGQKKVSG
jgi:hypothetical protein